MRRVLTEEQHAWVRSIRVKRDELRREAKSCTTRKGRSEIRRQMNLLPSVVQQAEVLGVSHSTITRSRAGRTFKRQPPQISLITQQETAP